MYLITNKSLIKLNLFNNTSKQKNKKKKEKRKKTEIKRRRNVTVGTTSRTHTLASKQIAYIHTFLSYTCAHAKRKSKTKKIINAYNLVGAETPLG